MPTRRQSKGSAKTKTRGAKKSVKKKATGPAHLPAGRQVHRWMNVMDIAAMHPGAADVLAAYGLHCVGCAYSEFDTLEAGASAHGLTDDDISNILVDLEKMLDSDGPRPKSLEITADAARSLLEIAKREGKAGLVSAKSADEAGYKLRVTSDESGGFCMEFTEKSESADISFFHREVPELVLIANDDTLSRIGGSTIDFRDGRFKLDVPKKTCVCIGEDCKCKKGADSE
jgi:hybrid cluster-associated redox disulfide protein